MKVLLFTLSLMLAGNPLFAESFQLIDDLEGGADLWSVEGEQHSSLEVVTEGEQGNKVLQIDIRRAVEGWSNIKLACACPENATGIRFMAKAVDASLEIHPQFKVTLDWKNWGLWLNPPLQLDSNEWKLYEVCLDSARSLFAQGEVDKDLLMQKPLIDSFLISANQDAAEGSLLIDDVEWILDE
ncbi:MAG: hypothetical protein KJ626_00755 [Verrucomicrobia bacterium]|nr:hypothetical protein [Verrucomicrobiota bacterium]